MLPLRLLRGSAAALLLGSVIMIPAMAQSPSVPTSGKTVVLAGHLPSALPSARSLDHVQANQPISFAITLPLRRQAELTDLLQRLQDPNDPQYGQYLTPVEFHARYSPSQADYDAVIAFARANGLQIVATHPNRLLLDVSASAATVERAFGLRLQNYQLPDGRTFRAPSSEPSIPSGMVGRISGLAGLDTMAVWHPHIRVPNVQADLLHPHVTGSGPGGGLSPSDIKTAYNLSSLNLNGTGQTIALFELDGYTASDITSYEQYFNLPSVTLQKVLVDNFSGAAGSGADEVTLDIELAIAVAPSINKVLVYEGPNTNTGVLDTYNKIATDNLAKQVSTSWGAAEQYVSSSTLVSENAIFEQMAAQGQSIYSAAGDSGAYDNGTTLSVDDPASQPYVVGVGGTSLTTNGAGGAWKSETTWNGGSVANGAGGGGISSVWSIPGYQSGNISTASKGSTTKRNVPDVSLNADPNNGYAIYYQGGWYIFGGTSCAAPLWAGFTSLVNQNRANNGSGTIGFPNPLLYKIGAGANYSSDFHDIADKSTNLYYPAVAGYDLATGWGAMNGANLLADLVSATPAAQPTQLLGNPGFENGVSMPAPWVATAGVVDNSSSEPAHSGSWKAWLDGYGISHTDTLYQPVFIPANITSATLSFYLHIDTAETTTTLAQIG